MNYVTGDTDAQQKFRVRVKVTQRYLIDVVADSPDDARELVGEEGLGAGDVIEDGWHYDVEGVERKLDE